MGNSPRVLPTGTVTFLFSDIEGSTRLIQERGAVAKDLPTPLEVLLARPNYVAELLETLGRERYERAAERGRRMSLDEAVDYAFAVSLDIEADVA